MAVNIEYRLPVFLSAGAKTEREVPRFVQQEMEASLDCSLIERGGLRSRCLH